MKEYYYFSEKDKKLGHTDGRKIKLGITHKVDCDPILCQKGLHASKRPLDALKFAPSSILWKVTLGGKVIHGEDESVATERTYVKGGIDISDTLRAFARKCALDVVHLWDAPQVVIDYLKTDNESLMDVVEDLTLASVRKSTRASTRAAAWASSWVLSWDSHRASVRARAMDWDSALALAQASSFASAFASARDSQNRRLAQMISKALKESKGE